MKKIEPYKFVQTISIIAIVVAAFLFIENYENKSNKKQEDAKDRIYSALCDVYERLDGMASDIDFAYKTDDFECMQDELGISKIRVEDISVIIKDIAEEFYKNY